MISFQSAESVSVIEPQELIHTPKPVISPEAPPVRPIAYLVYRRHGPQPTTSSKREQTCRQKRLDPESLKLQCSLYYRRGLGTRGNELYALRGRRLNWLRYRLASSQDPRLNTVCYKMRNTRNFLPVIEGRQELGIVLLATHRTGAPCEKRDTGFGRTAHWVPGSVTEEMRYRWDHENVLE
jgi:hypothetical protein